MFNTAPLNTFAFNTRGSSSTNTKITLETSHLILTTYAPIIIVTDIYHPKSFKYIIEVHDSDGDLISILENYHDASLILKVNEPPRLSFSLPAGDVKKLEVVLPNELWVRNYLTDTIVKKLRITNNKDNR